MSNGSGGGGMRDPYHYEGFHHAIDESSSNFDPVTPHVKFLESNGSGLVEGDGGGGGEDDVTEILEDHEICLELPEFSEDPLKRASLTDQRYNTAGNFEGDNVFISGVIIENPYCDSPSPSDRRDNDILLGRSSSTAGWGWKPNGMAQFAGIGNGGGDGTDSDANQNNNINRNNNPAHARRITFTDHPPPPNFRRKSSRLSIYCSIFLGILFIVMAVVIVILAEKQQPRPGGLPYALQEEEDEEELNLSATRHHLMHISGRDPLFDENSMQYKALEWVSNNYNPLMDEATIQETYIITLLYFLTKGEHWTAQNNFLDSSKSICQWNMGHSQGVHCDKHHSVYRIALERCNLQGPIPHELFALSNMEYFEVGTNRLSGTIPKEIVALHSLKMVRFSVNNNELTGTIPVDFSRLHHHLVVFDVEHNKLTGRIPPEFGELTNLHNFQVKDNSLRGTVPTEIGEMSSLRVLTLAENRFTGTFPIEIGTLHQNLTRVELDHNDILGDLDPMFCSSSSSPLGSDDVIIKADSCHANAKVSCTCCCCSNCN